jgi:hypothetical protein
MRRLGAIIIALACALPLAACGRSDGLPEPSDERGGPAPEGTISLQLPFLPITFSLGLDGTVRYSVSTPKLVTPLAAVWFSLGSAVGANHQPLPAPAPDVTELIICQLGGDGQPCSRYQIGTGRIIRIEMDGKFVTEVQQNRYTIKAAPGATIKVTDSGRNPPPDIPGPARINIETFDFSATGNETEVDLERSRSGTAVDLGYNHITGAITLLHGTTIARVNTFGGFSFAHVKNNVPAEVDCLQATDWRTAFTPNELASDWLVSCVKTAEGDLGYIYLTPDQSQRPVGYSVYSYIWVR